MFFFFCCMSGSKRRKLFPLDLYTGYLFELYVAYSLDILFLSHPCKFFFS